MKLMRNELVTGIYKGILPVREERKKQEEKEKKLYGKSYTPYPKDFGIKKYISYDHVFANIEGNGFMYSFVRAKTIPYEIPTNAKVTMEVNFRSSILTNIKIIKIEL